jgi:hypothetical protein
MSRSIADRRSDSRSPRHPRSDPEKSCFGGCKLLILSFSPTRQFPCMITALIGTQPASCPSSLTCLLAQPKKRQKLAQPVRAGSATRQSSAPKVRHSLHARPHIPIRLPGFQQSQIGSSDTVFEEPATFTGQGRKGPWSSYSIHGWIEVLSGLERGSQPCCSSEESNHWQGKKRSPGNR